MMNEADKKWDEIDEFSDKINLAARLNEINGCIRLLEERKKVILKAMEENV